MLASRFFRTTHNDKIAHIRSIARFGENHKVTTNPRMCLHTSCFSTPSLKNPMKRKKLPRKSKSVASPSSAHSKLALGILLAATFTTAVSAATVTWDAGGLSPTAPAGGTGLWDTSSANWSNGTAENPWNSGDIAAFGGSPGTVTLITISAGGLTFSTSGYTLTGGALKVSQEMLQQCNQRLREPRRSIRCLQIRATLSSLEFPLFPALIVTPVRCLH